MSKIIEFSRTHNAGKTTLAHYLLNAFLFS